MSTPDTARDPEIGEPLPVLSEFFTSGRLLRKIML